MGTSDNDFDPAEAADLRSAARAAWFETSMEKDRSLLTLSAGAIGLLITLASTTPVRSKVLFGLSVAAFVACIIAILIVFNLNRGYLLAVVQGTAPLKDEQLERLDGFAMAAFCAGVILFAAFGISTSQGS